MSPPPPPTDKLAACSTAEMVLSRSRGAGPLQEAAWVRGRSVGLSVTLGVSELRDTRPAFAHHL